MTISEKTRKILWGRAASRCCICKKELVIDPTKADEHSIVGEECHIRSAKPAGPRWDSTFPKENFDVYENLILLCRIHHKVVDDQVDEYTVDKLKSIKDSHEAWVNSGLDPEMSKLLPVQVRRIKENIPLFLSRLQTGKELLSIVSGTSILSYDYDDDLSKEETTQVGSFLELIQDYGDIVLELGIGQRIEVEFSIQEEFEKLEAFGFFVFGAREKQLLEGGLSKKPVDWIVAHIRITRSSSTEIIKAPGVI